MRTIISVCGEVERVGGEVEKGVVFEESCIQYACRAAAAWGQAGAGLGAVTLRLE